MLYSIILTKPEGPDYKVEIKDQYLSNDVEITFVATQPQVSISNIHADVCCAPSTSGKQKLAD